MEVCAARAEPGDFGVGVHKHWRDQLDASEIGRWALHEQWTHYAGFFRALSFNREMVHLFLELKLQG